MNEKPVLVVGSAALDSVESPLGKVEDALGGSSFFFSTAASLFAPVRLVAVIGSDFPMEKIEFLKGKNVDTTGLETAEGETFRWGGVYHEDPNLRDTLFTKLGVFENFDPKLPEDYRNTPIVFLGNIHPALQLKVLDQLNNPELVVLDTMNFWIDGTPDLLEKVISRVDAMIINDEEAAMLTGQTDLRKAAANLFERGPSSIIIKKGQHGAVLLRKDGDIFCIPAYPVNLVKDPTGAGDTFAGGFVSYFAKHDFNNSKNWRQAIVHGTIVASYVVEDFSMDRTRNLTVEEVKERIGTLRRMTEF